MVKVKCITNLNMLYFAGEIYEIPRSLYDAHPTCFELLPEVPGVNAFPLPDNKQVNAGDVMTKTADALGDLHPEAEAKAEEEAKAKAEAKTKTKAPK